MFTSATEKKQELDLQKSIFVKPPELLLKTLFNKILGFKIDDNVFEYLGNGEDLKQLLYAANILTKDQLENEMELHVKWIISICKETLFKEGESKADLIRLILQVTHKQDDIASVDFNPLLVSGILTSKDVSDIKAKPAIENPHLKQILAAIEKRNVGRLNIYRPLVKAGLMDKDYSYISAALYSSISPYKKDVLTEKEKIEKCVKPFLAAMQQEAELFNEVYAPLKELFSAQELFDARYDDVTTPNTFYADDVHPFAAAASKGYLEIVKLLIQNGAEYASVMPNPKDEHHRAAPLVSAVRGGNLEMVKLFLDAGADVNQSERFGSTPLEEAAELKHTEILELLLKHKDILLVQDFHSYSNYENTALSTALRLSKVESLNLIMNITVAKLSEGMSQFPGIPAWLLIDLLSGLHDLQNTNFERPGGFSLSVNFFLGPWLDDYKFFLMNKTLELILNAAKNLPSVIEVQDHAAIKIKFKSIIKEQHEILLKEMEAAKNRISAEHRETAPKVVHKMKSEIGNFLNMSLCLRNACVQMITGHYDHRPGSKPSSLIAVESMINALMKTELTQLMLKDMLGELFCIALQKNQLDLIQLLLKTASLFEDNANFYIRAIDLAAYFGRVDLLKTLLQDHKNVDINSVIGSAASGFMRLRDHVDNVVNSLSKMGWGAKSAQLSPMDLSEIGLNDKLTDPQEAREMLLNNLKLTIEVLFNSGLDLKLLDPAIIAGLDQSFPHLFPDDSKLKLYQSNTSIVINEEDSKMILETLRDKTWKTDLRGFCFFTKDEAQKLSQTILLSYLQSEEHKADVANPNKVMIGLKLSMNKGDASMKTAAPYFVPKECVEGMFEESKPYNKSNLLKLVDALAKDSIKQRVHYSNMLSENLKKTAIPMDTKEDQTLTEQKSQKSPSLSSRGEAIISDLATSLNKVVGATPTHKRKSDENLEMSPKTKQKLL